MQFYFQPKKKKIFHPILCRKMLGKWRLVAPQSNVVSPRAASLFCRHFPKAGNKSIKRRCEWWQKTEMNARLSGEN